jgi:hypothetical protein
VVHTARWRSPANFIVVIIVTTIAATIVFTIVAVEAASIISIASISRQLTSIAVALTVVFATIVIIATIVALVGHNPLPVQPGVAVDITTFAARWRLVVVVIPKFLPSAIIFLVWSIFPLLSSIALLILVIAIAVIALTFVVTLVALAFTAVVIFALVVLVVKATFHHLVRPIFLEEEGAMLALEELTVAP